MHTDHMKKDTSWGKVADWYHELMKDEDSYQQQVILPNVLRTMEIKKGEHILDLACGQGFFSVEFSKAGAKVIGIDISPELIGLARNNLPKSIPKGITFIESSADDLSTIEDATIDKIAIILAIQNIEHIKLMLEECRRVLKPGGNLYIVMNHPTFRIPKSSSWQWNEKEQKQYRRIDAYLSEKKVSIEMNPGRKFKDKKAKETVSFHRSLQYYFKLFHAAHFHVIRLEEWISHKKSQSGPRGKEEDRIRKEIPLFLFLQIRKQ